jgi:hypothetical protein
MSQLQFQLKEALEVNRHLKETVELTEQKLRLFEEENNLLTRQNKECQEMIEKTDREWNESQQLCRRLREEKEAIDRDRAEEKEQWSVERETSRREKVFLELQIETLTKSNEKNEER